MSVKMRQLLDESKGEAKVIFQYFVQLEAPEMEEFLLLASDYFKRNSDEMINMDASGISKDLYNAYQKVSKRTSD